ncbi:MAG: GGDEF domain-containing protein [Cyanobium sp.]
MTLAPSAERFPRLFPFHWVVDADMVVTQLGDALRRLLGEQAIGAPLDDVIRWMRPAAVNFSLEGLARLRDRLAVLQLRQLPLQLKGEVLVENGHGFFLGSPAVHSLEGLRQLGIVMADLPRHDGLLDSVLRLQINELLLQDGMSKRTRELSELATHDELTGVANRRLFRRDIQAELLQHRRLGAPLALLMIDIDHFKLFNDAHGHLAGDACLQAAAQRLVALVGRGGDRVYRYGGEEFAVLLPHSDLSGAGTVAARVVHGFASSPLAMPEQNLASPITVSVGIACAEPDSADPITETVLISRADRALYRAKHAGRSRYVRYGLDPC